MAWQITFHHRLNKQLRRLPKKEAQRIFAVIKLLTIDPYSGDIQKVDQKQNVWRRRVGSCRIFYKLFPDRRMVFVFDVRRRTTTSYRR